MTPVDLKFLIRVNHGGTALPVTTSSRFEFVRLFGENGLCMGVIQADGSLGNIHDDVGGRYFPDVARSLFGGAPCAS